MSPLILAINTAQAIHELALIEETSSQGLKCLKEGRWMDDKKDVESMVPRLSSMLEETGTHKKEIQKIVVVKGPGSFTSVRTGVAFANALAEGLSAELYELTTFQMLARKSATTDPLLVLLPAGGLDVGVYHAGETTVGPLASVLAKHPHDHSYKVLQELSETLRDELHSIALEKEWQVLEAHELQTLGESFETLGFEACTLLQAGACVEPLYLKGPKITRSEDPWKQPRA